MLIKLNQEAMRQAVQLYCDKLHLDVLVDHVDPKSESEIHVKVWTPMQPKKNVAEGIW